MYMQVLSESVYKALVTTGGEEAWGTAHFVMMFDRFFDCLNVNSFTAGKHKRKQFQDPYRSPSDFRLKVCDENLKFFKFIFYSGHFFFVLFSGWKMAFWAIWENGRKVFVSDLGSQEQRETTCC